MKNTAILLFVFMSSIVYAQNKTADDFNLSKTRLAVQGYDVVSYFNDEPKEGDKAIQSTVEGVHYYFSSQKNTALFDKNLNRYIPKYGGWCAYAMSRGDTVSINPEAYLIQDDSLYLFYKTRFTNTITKWKKTPKDYQKKADTHWNQ
mgnify:FL=1